MFYSRKSLKINRLVLCPFGYSSRFFSNLALSPINSYCSLTIKHASVRGLLHFVSVQARFELNALKVSLRFFAKQQSSWQLPRQFEFFLRCSERDASAC